MSLENKQDDYFSNRDEKRSDSGNDEYWDEINEFDSKHGAVLVEGKLKIAYLEFDQTNKCTALKMADKPAMMDFYSNRLVKKIVNGKEKYAPICKEWFDSKNRRTYTGVTFKPIAGLVATNAKLPKQINGALNLYSGLAIPPIMGDCQLIIQHINEVWCNGNHEQFTYVMNWLARMMQKPHLAGETVIVLKSGQGTGKNIIVDILANAFGNHAITATKPQDVLGTFNDHLATSVLIFMNEALWGGDKSSEGALKSLITDDYLFCERKYMPKFKINNCAHVVMATNNDWYAPMDSDDRRYVVLDVSEKRKGDFEYFNVLKSQIDNGGAEAFIHYLMNHNINEFKHRTLPKSQGASKFANKLMTASSVTKWWFECLQEGHIIIEEFMDHKVESNNQAIEWETKEIKLKTKELHDSYCQWCKKHNQRYIETSSQLIVSMNKVCPDIRNGTGRPRTKIIPTLMTSRLQFGLSMQSEINWDEESAS